MSEGSGMDARTLVEWLKSPIRFRNMPFGKHKGVAIDRVPYPYLKWLKAQDLDEDMTYTLSHI
jgi:uncharacterized protein (DUF3820 family)